MKTGRDVIIAALLGAEEFGFATAPLVVSGCIMMRVCHLDTCPVGIATQNPELRKKFSGQPEFVVNFFEFIAQEVREYLAMLGFRSVAEAVGRVDRINAQVAVDHWKASGLDIAPLLAVPQNPYNSTPYHSVAQDHGLADALDNRIDLTLCSSGARRWSSRGGVATNSQREPQRWHHAGQPPHQVGWFRLGRRHHHTAIHRVGWTIVRCVRATRYHHDVGR